MLWLHVEHDRQCFFGGASIDTLTTPRRHSLLLRVWVSPFAAKKLNSNLKEQHQWCNCGHRHPEFKNRFNSIIHWLNPHCCWWKHHCGSMFNYPMAIVRGSKKQMASHGKPQKDRKGNSCKTWKWMGFFLFGHIYIVNSCEWTQLPFLNSWSGLFQTFTGRIPWRTLGAGARSGSFWESAWVHCNIKTYGDFHRWGVCKMDG